MDERTSELLSALGRGSVGRKGREGEETEGNGMKRLDWWRGYVQVKSEVSGGDSLSCAVLRGGEEGGSSWTCGGGGLLSCVSLSLARSLLSLSLCVSVSPSPLAVVRSVVAA